MSLWQVDSMIEDSHRAGCKETQHYCLNISMYTIYCPTPDGKEGPVMFLSCLYVFCVCLSACLLEKCLTNHSTNFIETLSIYWVCIYNSLTFGVYPIQDGCHSHSTLNNTQMAKTQSMIQILG